MSEIAFEKRIIAYLDILGFKKIIHDSISDMTKFDNIHCILNFLKTWERPDEWGLSLIEIEEDAKKNNIEYFDIREISNCTCFSDTIVISVNVEDKDINSIFSTLISNLSTIGLKLLLDGVLIRGGITLGELIHKDNGVIVGPALIDAYELEDNCAKYPRIILSDKIIKELNYPLDHKNNRYPYHQYLKRFDDGCVGFHQMIYYQVLQSWVDLDEEEMKRDLRNIKKQIITGLDNSFENPSVYEKYIFLKDQYEKLCILGEGLKEKFYELNEDISKHNIHFGATESFYSNRNK